ncbi:unnamed protein product [Euphydryas editha]|uniref:Uncharacterized protein n=1 Tax=Euphydryas editha TaxID=104508 RepID=A0AAU9TW33_EUPED|nr:unnamed protein product [Euphydryas editha]
MPKTGRNAKKNLQNFRFQSYTEEKEINLLKRKIKLSNVNLVEKKMGNFIKGAKKKHVESLLKKQFREDWKNEPSIKWYCDILYESNVGENYSEDNENRCDCLESDCGELHNPNTYMKADSMHRAIESQKKETSVYSMQDWSSVCERARQELEPWYKNLKTERISEKAKEENEMSYEEIMTAQKKTLYRYKKQIENLKESLKKTENEFENLRTLGENPNPVTEEAITPKFIQETIPNICSPDKERVKKAILENYVLKQSLSDQYSKAKSKSEKDVFEDYN